MDELTKGIKYKLFLSNGFKYDVIILDISENFIFVRDITTNKEFKIGIAQITTATEVLN